MTPGERDPRREDRAAEIEPRFRLQADERRRRGYPLPVEGEREHADAAGRLFDEWLGMEMRYLDRRERRHREILRGDATTDLEARTNFLAGETAGLLLAGHRADRADRARRLVGEIGIGHARRSVESLHAETGIGADVDAGRRALRIARVESARRAAEGDAEQHVRSHLVVDAERAAIRGEFLIGRTGDRVAAQVGASAEARAPNAPALEAVVAADRRRRVVLARHRPFISFHAGRRVGEGLDTTHDPVARLRIAPQRLLVVEHGGEQVTGLQRGIRGAGDDAVARELRERASDRGIGALVEREHQLSAQA